MADPPRLRDGAASRVLLDTAAVCARLAVSRDWWSRHHVGLIETHGFPAPLPGLGRRWDPRAIDAWLDRRLPCDATAAANDERDWAAELDRRVDATRGAESV